MPLSPNAEDPQPTQATTRASTQVAAVSSPSPPPTEAELRAMWSLHRLQAPTFDDLTAGLCLGLVWCMALWTPMFLATLL